MNIYESSFKRQLKMLSHLSSLRSLFSQFKEQNAPHLRYYLSRVEEAKHIEDFAVSDFSFTGVELPSADQSFTAIDAAEFYKQHLQRLATLAFPFSQIRLNEESLSIRIPSNDIAQADKVLRAFQDDAYWNDYFTRNDKPLADLLNEYSSSKSATDRRVNDSSSLLNSQTRGDFTYFRITLPKEVAASFIPEEEFQHSSLNRSFANNGLESMDTGQLNRFAGSAPVHESMLSSLFSYLNNIFFLNELYDYVKADMQEHYTQLHDKLATERRQAFNRLESWYRTTHVDDENKVYKPLFEQPLETLPEKMELFLYSSKENHEWVANIMGPTSENPVIDGYALPVVGVFTKTVNDSGRLTVNEYFDVQLDLERARAVWLEHSEIEKSLALDGYTAVSDLTVSSWDEEIPAEAPPEPEDARPEPEPESSMETVTIDELFRRHGLEVPEPAASSEPDFEEVDDPHAPRPTNFRVTKVNNRFNVFYQQNGQEIFASNLDHDALKRLLQSNHLVTNFPYVLIYDTDQGRERSLDRPFATTNNYLIY